MIIEELQNCIWRVASINLGFDGCKCSFSGWRIADGYLQWSNPQFTPQKKTLQIQYCYFYSYPRLKIFLLGLRKGLTMKKKLKCSERLVYDFGTSLVQTHFYQTHITGGRFVVRSQWTYLYCSFSSCKGSNDSGLTHECQYFCHLFH